MIPEQTRAVDPFQSYLSSEVNKLTRIITSGQNKIVRDEHLFLSPHDDSENEIDISSGYCIKDDVLIELIGTTTLDLEDKSNYTNEEKIIGDAYIVLSYNFSKDRQAPQAKIIICKPNEFNSNVYLFLGKVVFLDAGILDRDASDNLKISNSDQTVDPPVIRQVANFDEPYTNSDSVSAISDVLESTNTINLFFDSTTSKIKGDVISDNTTIINTSSGISIKDDGVDENKINSSSFGNGLIGGSGDKIRLGYLDSSWHVSPDTTSSEITITDIPDPIQDLDVSNKRFVKTKLSGVSNFVGKDTLDDTETPEFGATHYLQSKESLEAGITKLDAELYTHAVNLESDNPHNISLEIVRTKDNVLQGPIDMGGFLIHGLPNPTDLDDAATKEYVDNQAGGASGTNRYGELFSSNTSQEITVLHNLTYRPMVQVLDLSDSDNEVEICPDIIEHLDVNHFRVVFSEFNIPSEIQVLYW